MERETIRHDEDQVYVAAEIGSVETLNTLIRKDPRILRKLSLTNQTETPLHVSALLGHAEFTKTLSGHYPRLAQRQDSKGRTPLHLAAAEGHRETLPALLSVYADACLAYDESGRTPLHYAAMRGEVEVVKELIEAKPGSVYFRVEGRSEETVLHLCVKHNQLECLKLLVEKIGDEDGEFLNSKAGCDSGITVLQLALMRRHIKIIRYLLSLAVVRAGANAARGTTWTMLDVVEHGGGSLEINQILMKAGIKTERSEYDQLPSRSASEAASSPDPISKPNRAKKHRLSNKLQPKKGADGERGHYWNKVIKYVKCPSDWLVEKCDMLMVVSIMISTINFNAMVNPPGGVWSENNTNFTQTVGNQTKTICSEISPCLAGTAVSGNLWTGNFHNFITYNTVSFLASLTVTLLLVSGFPLHNRVCMWLLSMAMVVTLTFMALTYVNVLFLVVPFGDLLGASYETYKKWFTIWVALLGGVGIMHTIRFLFWGGSRLWPFYFKSKSGLESIITGSSRSVCETPMDAEEKFAQSVSV